MKVKYSLLIFVISFCFSLTLKAQWDPQISQYWRTKTFFNPSFAAENDTLQVGILYRMQWDGIRNAPKTAIVNADMPLTFLGRKHGVGLVAMTESIGLFKNINVGGQYVYKKRIKRNMLNVGIQISYTSVGFDGTRINTAEQEDLEGLIQEVNSQSSKVDGNIGVSWLGPNYYVGLSTTHLLQPSFEIDENLSSYIARVYYLTAGYNFKLRNPLYELQPSILVKADEAVFQCDVTARLVYNKIFNGGISWRKDDGFVFLLGMNILGFDAGYAFDLSTSDISKASNGTHEFFLRYIIPMKQKKKGQYSHKSIRLL